MKKWAGLLLVAAFILPALVPSRAESSIIISELCDPLNNYVADRFIEITNAGTDTVDLAGWTLIAVGNSANIMTWPLTGLIAPGQAMVAGNVTTVTLFTVTFGNDLWGANNSTWNGKIGDGAKLVNPSAVTVDYVVVPGTVFENCDYVRKPSIYVPNTVYTASEWTATAVTLATDASPGTHTLNPRPPGPSIKQVVTDPAVPLAGVGVDVLADVTDSTATITSVLLFWGTTTSSLPNQIAMPLYSGSTYRTGAPIPAQAEGVTIYYRVQATDDAPATNLSDVLSYMLDYVLTIHQIQGEVSTSPYNGLGVITHGIVTARYPSCLVVQDGSGPWKGLWVRSSATPAVGDSVTVRGQVTENDVQGLAGNTLLTSGLVLDASTGVTFPPPAAVTSATASSEAYEGVLVAVAGAICTNAALGQGQWLVNDGSGASRVGPLGYAFTPTLGTTYDVTGPVTYSGGAYLIEPRGAGDVVWVADHTAPVVIALFEESDSTLLVTFSEPLDEASAVIPGHYTTAGLNATATAFDSGHPEQILVTVPGIPAGSATFVATGVADLYANATTGATWTFNFVDTSIPAGYYDSAVGLRGTALRAALHNIIRNHLAQSYDYAFTAFQTTDVKPNKKVWDMYSDIPGGTPPYEYTFGQTGGGTAEGTGYNREHSWPKTWFGGTVLPMYSDLWILYPTDTKVNNYRGDLPYGDVASATTTSLNGSQVGSCADDGYTATVFEPIDPFKGDLARSYFYVSTRYYTEDGTWPGSAATSGADLLPWASQACVAWHTADPVSQKERLRNGAIYVIQQNRNPFVDHPEFAGLIFDSTSTTAVADGPALAFRLYPSAPNPFHPATMIRFDLPRRAAVSLWVYDVAGRLVRNLVEGNSLEAGRHEVTWDGQSESGRAVGAGVYFCRLQAGSFSETRRMVRTR
jgi:endonuclease I